MMKFSIVVPSFNQGSFLEKTLESILSQKGDFDIECLVFDGGSKDNSIEILKETDKKVKKGLYSTKLRKVEFFWVSRKDDGQSDAINQGLKKATGDIVAYLNSDDMYKPDAFSVVQKAFLENPKLNWFTGYCSIIDAKGNIKRSTISSYKNYWLRHYSYKKLLVLNFISQPSTFWRRTILEKYGLFNEQLNYVMDYEFWLRIGKDNEPVIIRKELAEFRVHDQSKGETAFKKQFSEDLEVAEKYSSVPLAYLHRLHNALIVQTYKIVK